MNRISASTVNTAVVTLALIVCAATSGGQQVSESSKPVPPPARESDLDRHLDELTSKLDNTGPHIWGAHSWADLNVDFWGAGSSANYTVTAGTIRLRTMHARVEWPNRSIMIAVDRPLMSPWQPASWVTVAEPALAWSGN